MANIVPEEREWALLIITVFSMVGTEFTSNTSMASIMLPIADSLVNSLY